MTFELTKRIFSYLLRGYDKTKLLPPVWRIRTVAITTDRLDR
jgi:hypothetical protein